MTMTIYFLLPLQLLRTGAGPLVFPFSEPS